MRGRLRNIKLKQSIVVELAAKQRLISKEGIYQLQNSERKKSKIKKLNLIDGGLTFYLPVVPLV